MFSLAILDFGRDIGVILLNLDILGVKRCGIFREYPIFLCTSRFSTSQEDEDERLVYQVTHALKEQLSDVPPSLNSSIEH